MNILISNAIQLKGRLFGKMRFSTNTCTKRVSLTFSFKPFFTFLLLDLNIGQENETFIRKLFALLPDELFKQWGIKSEFTLCEKSTC